MHQVGKQDFYCIKMDGQQNITTNALICSIKLMSKLQQLTQQDGYNNNNNQTQNQSRNQISLL